MRHALRIAAVLFLAIGVSDALAQQQPGDCGYYTNSSGNRVPRPCGDSTQQCPKSATARCGDGTCSYSQHRSGTCSGHHGVAEWLQ
jgi:hypothetical protein